MPNDIATRTIVAHGLPVSSPRMPGISPLRRRSRRGLPARAVGFARRAFGRLDAPAPREPLRCGLAGAASGRAIFGARLRSRVPQYGHSVTYGLTSAWQFLHTT